MSNTKELLSELKEMERVLYQQISDTNFWLFIKIIKLESKIKNLQSIIKLVDLYANRT